MHAAGIVGIIGSAFFNAGIGDAGKKFVALQIVEVVIAEHMISGSGKRHEQCFDFSQVGSRVGTGGKSVHKIAEFDDETGLFLIHGFEKDLHLVHGGRVDAGVAVGLAGSVHVDDDAGFKYASLFPGCRREASGQGAGSGADGGGHAHFQDIAVGDVFL